MGLESQYYFQIVTSNRQRALAIQQALPGGRSVHFSFSPVNEDLAKGIESGDHVSIPDALSHVQHVAEYKGQRDFVTVGNTEGALDQLLYIGKPREDAQGFPYLARVTIDSSQLVFEDPHIVRLLQKPLGSELLHLPDKLSGRRTAIITAITRIVAPLEESLATSKQDLIAHMSTVIVMTSYTLQSFTRQQYKDFVFEVGGPERIRNVAGGLPFADNPFVDTREPYEIRMVNPHSYGEQVLDRGWNWEELNRSQCVHGAFPDALQSLLVEPGVPLARSGDIFKR